MTNPHLLGLLLGIGLTLVALSFLPRAQPAAAHPPPGDGWEGVGRRRWRPRPGRTGKMVQVGAALFAGVGCWLVFRLPVLAVAATVAGAAPLLVRRRPTDVAARDLGETATTVARWIEGVRDYLLTASTLQDALILASHDVRGPHARSFQRFAGALTGAGGYGPAAEDLANDLGSALADKALTALWIGGRDGGDIQTALGLLAESAQAEADNARRIEAGLAGTRRLVRIVSVLCLVILVLALFAFRENFGVYRSPGGQVLLSAGLAAMAGSWWGIWRMSKIEAPERLVTVRPVRGSGLRW